MCKKSQHQKSLDFETDAQNRIQKSKVLICGLRGLHVEVVKNIVLAGMNITIQDADPVKIQDLAHNFFLTESDVGKNVSASILCNPPPPYCKKLSYLN